MCPLFTDKDNTSAEFRKSTVGPPAVVKRQVERERRALLRNFKSAIQ